MSSRFEGTHRKRDHVLVLGQLLQQRLRFLQIARVEPLREPAVDRSQQFARLPHLALVEPEACKTIMACKQAPIRLSLKRRKVPCVRVRPSDLKFRHRARLHVFDKPFAIGTDQDVLRVSVGSNVILCFIDIEALEV